ncbi:hypothetical protein PUN28_008282 [Cardiocondyla obscurior]|uniref:Uncharacterized protein n=1 Tax=Cardiocondyla obscurior TaxID=286306 RepID=A0AAW2FWV6_9HYME
MYGNINNHNDTMPRHQFGQPMMYNIYAAIANVKVDWISLRWLAMRSKLLYRSRRRSYVGAYADGDIEIPRGSHNLQPHTTQINIKNREAELVTQRTDQCKALTSVGDISRLIENPTYALSTPQLVSADSNQNFTDTQALFEIVAECEINTAYPTHRPGTKETNVPFDEQYFFTNQYIDSYSPMIAGQYIKDTS